MFSKHCLAGHCLPHFAFILFLPTLYRIIPQTILKAWFFLLFNSFAEDLYLWNCLSWVTSPSVTYAKGSPSSCITFHWDAWLHCTDWFCAIMLHCTEPLFKVWFCAIKSTQWKCLLHRTVLFSAIKLVLLHITKASSREGHNNSKYWKSRSPTKWKVSFFVNMDIYGVGLVQIWNGSTFPGRKNWRNWRMSLLIFRLFPSGTFDLDLDLQEVQIKISWDRKSCRTLSRFWFQNPHLSFLPQVHPSWTWFCNFSHLLRRKHLPCQLNLFHPLGRLRVALRSSVEIAFSVQQASNPARYYLITFVKKRKFHSILSNLS